MGGQCAYRVCVCLPLSVGHKSWNTPVYLLFFSLHVLSPPPPLIFFFFYTVLDQSKLSHINSSVVETGVYWRSFTVREIIVSPLDTSVQWDLFRKCVHCEKPSPAFLLKLPRTSPFWQSEIPCSYPWMKHFQSGKLFFRQQWLVQVDTVLGVALKTCAVAPAASLPGSTPDFLRSFFVCLSSTSTPNSSTRSPIDGIRGVEKWS